MKKIILPLIFGQKSARYKGVYFFEKPLISTVTAEYIEQSKEFYKKIQSLEEKSEKVEVDGIFIPKKLLSKKSNRTCPTCNSYSFKLQDDVYMSKYGCCLECFYQYVDGSEESWTSGWRPKGE